FAQPLGNGRMPQNPDNSYAGTPSHFHVLRCVSNIDAGAGFAPKLANGKLRLQGVRLAMGHSVTEDTHGKKRLIIRRPPRSEERRVGKECRSRWSPYNLRRPPRPTLLPYTTLFHYRPR